MELLGVRVEASVLLGLLILVNAAPSLDQLKDNGDVPFTKLKDHKTDLQSTTENAFNVNDKNNHNINNITTHSDTITNILPLNRENSGHQESKNEKTKTPLAISQDLLISAIMSSASLMRTFTGDPNLSYQIKNFPTDQKQSTVHVVSNTKVNSDQKDAKPSKLSTEELLNNNFDSILSKHISASFDSSGKPLRKSKRIYPIRKNVTKTEDETESLKIRRIPQETTRSNEPTSFESINKKRKIITPTTNDHNQKPVMGVKIEDDSVTLKQNKNESHFISQEKNFFSQSSLKINENLSNDNTNTRKLKLKDNADNNIRRKNSSNGSNLYNSTKSRTPQENIFLNTSQIKTTFDYTLNGFKTKKEENYRQNASELNVVNIRTILQNATNQNSKLEVGNNISGAFRRNVTEVKSNTNREKNNTTFVKDSLNTRDDLYTNYKNLNVSNKTNITTGIFIHKDNNLQTLPTSIKNKTDDTAKRVTLNLNYFTTTTENINNFNQEKLSYSPNNRPNIRTAIPVSQRNNQFDSKQVISQKNVTIKASQNDAISATTMKSNGSSIHYRGNTKFKTNNQPSTFSNQYNSNNGGFAKPIVINNESDFEKFDKTIYKNNHNFYSKEGTSIERPDLSLRTKNTEEKLSENYPIHFNKGVQRNLQVNNISTPSTVNNFNRRKSDRNENGDSFVGHSQSKNDDDFLNKRSKNEGENDKESQHHSARPDIILKENYPVTQRNNRITTTQLTNVPLSTAINNESENKLDNLSTINQNKTSKIISDTEQIRDNNTGSKRRIIKVVKNGEISNLYNPQNISLENDVTNNSSTILNNSSFINAQFNNGYYSKRRNGEGVVTLNSTGYFTTPATNINDESGKVASYNINDTTRNKSILSNHRNDSITDSKPLNKFVNSERIKVTITPSTGDLYNTQTTSNYNIVNSTPFGRYKTTTNAFKDSSNLSDLSQMVTENSSTIRNKNTEVPLRTPYHTEIVQSINKEKLNNTGISSINGVQNNKITTRIPASTSRTVQRSRGNVRHGNKSIPEETENQGKTQVYSSDRKDNDSENDSKFNNKKKSGDINQNTRTSEFPNNKYTTSKNAGISVEYKTTESSILTSKPNIENPLIIFTKDEKITQIKISPTPEAINNKVKINNTLAPIQHISSPSSTREDKFNYRQNTTKDTKELLITDEASYYDDQKKHNENRDNNFNNKKNVRLSQDSRTKVESISSVTTASTYIAGESNKTLYKNNSSLEKNGSNTLKNLESSTITGVRGSPVRPADVVSSNNVFLRDERTNQRIIVNQDESQINIQSNIKTEGSGNIQSESLNVLSKNKQINIHNESPSRVSYSQNNDGEGFHKMKQDENYDPNENRGGKKFSPSKFETISPFFSDSELNKLYSDKAKSSSQTFIRSNAYDTNNRHKISLNAGGEDSLDETENKAFDRKNNAYGQFRGNVKYTRNPWADYIYDDDFTNYPPQFSYRYKTPTGISVYQKGTRKEINNQQVFVIKGAYQYTSPDGTPVLVKYTADEKGFHPVSFPGQTLDMHSINTSDETKDTLTTPNTEEELFLRKPKEIPLPVTLKNNISEYKKPLKNIIPVTGGSTLSLASKSLSSNEKNKLDQSSSESETTSFSDTFELTTHAIITESDILPPKITFNHKSINKDDDNITLETVEFPPKTVKSVTENIPLKLNVTDNNTPSTFKIKS